MKFRHLIAGISVAASLLAASYASAITPKKGWLDSYSVGGKCYCATTFDHGIGNFKVKTPAGTKTVREVCNKIGKGPGKGKNPVYNTVQCGHEPGHSDAIKIGGRKVKDEKECPGRVDQGAKGCKVKGPKWDLSVFGKGNGGGNNNNNAKGCKTNNECKTSCKNKKAKCKNNGKNKPKQCKIGKKKC